MSDQCTPDIDALARELGFSCQDSPPALRLSNPFGLTNWTLPVIELLIVAGAVLALWWAVRRLRRDGDPVNLVLWCATVLYLLIVEPPLYFPAAFGVDELIGAVFAHNIFTVQFLYDRLPLYIVALYPAMAMVAYEIVRSLGIFRDRGIVVGAICVGFVHQCFYEVFDQLGPQLQWWTWNRGNVINEPMLASVPMASVLLFATVGPAVLTALVLLLVGGDRRRGTMGLALCILVVAVLVPVSMTIVNIPIALAGRGDPGGPLRWAVYVVYMALFAVIALRAMLPRLRRRVTGSEVPNTFVRVFGTAYLVVLAALWVAALAGVGDGPAGNVPYTAMCFLVAAVLTAAVSVRDSTAAGTEREEIAR
ncbi:hypothetical protein [Mycolicibacterium thermoresistibile]|jgi:hypothetical protein|uniref:Uncharacterized protein n=2 Tax=Mycolicibacterium thermoresistibile TaxID=1797 RepID=G7CL86_MYCT3|nr:hypothetical protein [Mycolicibacterium thermoresistibile]EHI11162.1 hypothetical protein KEK_18889 [Mycolicibacterium thermoresistibile ATCC 19527]MCV7188571.1 hypothetical protein [Mycolicibacterium thermoresistibile]GAT16446.1 putative uncharacterized protein [Mycolicibacterium thermoresistibile]SNW17636.1 Uncharacterised protein [Mycolicibacterium thermoresistibile]